MSDLPLTICPHCAFEGRVKRLISRTSFSLKGGGWYAQGYGATPPPATTSALASSSPKFSESAVRSMTSCPTAPVIAKP
jgi:predicted nucleic acid-binding Zn ribbon protein